MGETTAYVIGGGLLAGLAIFTVALWMFVIYGFKEVFSKRK